MSFTTLPTDMLRSILLFSLDYRSQVLLLKSVRHRMLVCHCFHKLISTDFIFWQEVYKEIGLRLNRNMSILNAIEHLKCPFGVASVDDAPDWRQYHLVYQADNVIFYDLYGKEVLRCTGTVCYSDTKMILEDKGCLYLFNEEAVSFEQLHIVGYNPIFVYPQLYNIYDTDSGLVGIFLHNGFSGRRYALMRFEFISKNMVKYTNLHVSDSERPSVTYNGLYRHKHFGISGLTFVPFKTGIGHRYEANHAIHSQADGINVVHTNLHVMAYNGSQQLYSILMGGVNPFVCLKRFLCIDDFVYDLFTGRVLANTYLGDRLYVKTIISSDDIFLIICSEL